MTNRDLVTTAGLASALRPSVQRLARRLRQMRDESLELSGNQTSAMAVLLNQGPLKIGELAAFEKVQPPSMTRIVDALEHRGYVTRAVSELDKRSCLVQLTPAGRDVVLADRRRRDAWLAVRLAELDAAERDVLRRAIPILEKVNHA